MPPFLLLAVAIHAAAAMASVGFEPQDPVLQMQVLGSGGTVTGTCVLFHTETRDRQVVLHFVTAGHLFNPQALGERQTAALRIRVLDGASNPIETTGRSVKFPGGVEGVLITRSSASSRPAPRSLPPRWRATHPPSASCSRSRVIEAAN